MKNCLIFSAFIPEQLKYRGYQYLNLINKYYSDCDVYIGLNRPYSAEVFNFIKTNLKYVTCNIVNTGLETNCDNSGYQKGLELLKNSGKQYDIVYMTHTKSITHNHDYDMCVEYIEEEFYKNRNEIESTFNDEKIGGWSFYGDVVEETSNDMDRFLKFQYKNFPISYWLTSYAIRGKIIDTFIHNCSLEFFNSKYQDIGFNRYFFEAYFPQIISKSGYIPYFKHHYKNLQESEKYSRIYDKIIKEGFKANE